MWFILLLSLLSSKLTAFQGVLPQGLLLDQVDRAHNEVIEEYFTLGYTATETLAFLWNVYGVKPYGFCIHGAIDGYSRKVLW